MITKQAFHFIYVNANSLTELALRHSFSDLDPLLEGIDSIDIDDMTLELDTNLEDLNFAAMDGLDFYDPEMEPHVSVPQEHCVEKELKTTTVKKVPIQTNDFDINSYMSNVYSLEKQLIERVDCAYKRIEHNHIKRLLSLLPPNLPSFDGKLSGEDMTLWLEQYSNDIESLTDLVIAIRQLDFT